MKGGVTRPRFPCALQFRIIVDGLRQSKVSGNSSRVVGGEYFFAPLESADKTPIYNLIGPLSSTLNGQKSRLPVHLFLTHSSEIRHQGVAERMNVTLCKYY
jgi:hypothetical protein